MSKRTGYMIKQINQLNQIRLNQMMAKFDLTASQTFTMIYLFKSYDRKIQVKQKDIEREMDISNPTVTGILNRLESKGLIERVECKDDARAKNICVTKKALKLDIELREMFIENETQLVSSLNDDEKKQLNYLLEKILSDLRDC